MKKKEKKDKKKKENDDDKGKKDKKDRTISSRYKPKQVEESTEAAVREYVRVTYSGVGRSRERHREAAKREVLQSNEVSNEDSESLSDTEIRIKVIISTVGVGETLS